MLTFGSKPSIAASTVAAAPANILPAWLSIIIWMSLGIGMVSDDDDENDVEEQDDDHDEFGYDGDEDEYVYLHPCISD